MADTKNLLPHIPRKSMCPLKKTSPLSSGATTVPSVCTTQIHERGDQLRKKVRFSFREQIEKCATPLHLRVFRRDFCLRCLHR